MLNIKSKLKYKAFGLTISSEWEFPELPVWTGSSEAIDVHVALENLTDLYHQLADKPDAFVVQNGLVLFQIPRVGLFAIREGNRITFFPTAEADPDEVRLLLLGTCMGALLMQRSILPLHGSALAINGKAYAIIGDSGAGKSTLATAFMNEGYRLLSDDVIAVSLTPQLEPYVTPSYPQQKLWQESLHHFGRETAPYRSVNGRADKYCVPVVSQYYEETLPLAGVFELIKSDAQEIKLQRIEKLERFHTLYYHTYRNFFLPGLGLTEWHFQTSAHMLRHIGLFRLRRPSSGFTAPQLVSAILHTLNGEE